ncbi:hypothetical protein QNI19_11105 [Cytophagaceae bacterium DM2B3-1]|uniref:Uncharacterized protein n=1 Tax=Xanthocytophaga flava TaxID=3048013 RepID=A0ABT7CIC9_9BACT|nr:hypothetical protein [Xanthocytophaga flavus]MDJ1493481.1 hypothetical protein [Xanthocytophaga flavus]
METLTQQTTIRIDGETYMGLTTHADLGTQPYERKLTLWIVVEDHHTWDKMSKCLQARQSMRVKVTGRYSGLFYIVKMEDMTRGAAFVLKNDGPFVIFKDN